MRDEPDAQPQEPTEPVQNPDPNTSPFESPSFETVEKGIDGPWEPSGDD
jgi:hypothetical protein